MSLKLNLKKVVKWFQPPQRCTRCHKSKVQLNHFPCNKNGCVEGGVDFGKGESQSVEETFEFKGYRSGWPYSE